MRSRKELVYLNISDLTPEEVDNLSDMELNCCDKCGEIDLSIKLHWIEGEDFYDNPAAQKLLKDGFIAVCDTCLKESKEV